MGKLDRNGDFSSNLEILLRDVGDDELGNILREQADAIKALAGNNSSSTRTPIIDAVRDWINASVREQIGTSQRTTRPEALETEGV